ncbi:MAG: ABC transporter ATP-binding protein [Candidatus Pacebacteria bacterium]|jgi:lipopolysaccharide transport system ATP-binding protein|nr:ABC transporter ATP-binding protein [Candidatus Paceibacterota bacterium]MBT6756054.1 ABC transporter ATP-binding protein [Candidatus Paceibacterota bacterium]
MKKIIEVKNISKKYKIGENKPYLTLRDSISSFFTNFFNKNKEDKLQKDEFWALKDISFTVNQGDVVGIIGKNGAGKSTLLKILSRITTPTSGEIKMRGRVGSLLEVGTGFQQELTGRENIFLNGSILGMKQKEISKKFAEIVDFAEISKFIDTPVKHYSSGMYMRLAFSIAAHLEPEILIIDEVLAVGDQQFQKKCLGKIEDISSKEGRTVLFVSHNMTAIESLCKSIILLENGKIIKNKNKNKQIYDYSRIARNSYKKDLKIKNSLKIENVKLSPKKISCGDSTSFFLKISSLKKTKINDICLIISNSLGSRVGIVDLRNVNNYPLNVGEKISFNGEINNVNLIEGNYDVSLYIKYDNINEEHLFNLDKFFVEYKKKRPGLSQYQASVRGIINFNEKFNYKINKK